MGARLKLGWKTRREKALEYKKLQKSNDLLATLAEGSAAFFAGVGLDGKLIDINSTMLKALGYIREEVIYTDYLSVFVPAADRSKVKLVLENCVRSQQPSLSESRVLTKSGQSLIVEWRNRPIKHLNGATDYILSIGVDITERKETEEALRISEKRFRTLFEQSLYSFQIFGSDGRVAYLNPACLNLWGLSQEQVPNNYNILKDEQLEANGVLSYIREAFEGKPKSIPPSYYDPAQTSGLRVGRGRWTRALAYPIKDENGKVREVVLNHEDITEQTLAQQRLKEAYQTLEQRVAERTQELSTLLEISRNMASTLQLRPLLSLILDQLKTVIDYSGSSITLIDGEEVHILEARRPGTNERMPEQVLNFPLEKSRALWETVRDGEVVIIDDVRSDTPLGRAYQEFAGDYLNSYFSYIRSWMAVPLVHKGRVVGLMSMSHIQPDFYKQNHATLARAIANQAAIAIENARLYEQSQQVAALEERQRLARELHDSVSQALFGISLGTNSARILLERDPGRVAQSLDYIYSLAQSGMAEMRALIFELRPESLEAEGLVMALTKQAAAIQARYGIDIQSQLGPEPPIPLAFKESLYRIGQEAMHNTVKHAQASRIDLRLETRPEMLVLEITDNGIGFDPDNAFPGHLGLRSMQERAIKLNGTLEIISVSGGGTSIVVKFRVPALV